jgi:hypothetical protein
MKFILDVARALNIDEAHAVEITSVAIKSIWVTFVSVFLGLSIDAYANGFHTLPALASYYQAHWLAWIIANVAAPLYRSLETARTFKKV